MDRLLVAALKIPQSQRYAKSPDLLPWEMACITGDEVEPKNVN